MDSIIHNDIVLFTNNLIIISNRIHNNTPKNDGIKTTILQASDS